MVELIIVPYSILTFIMLVVRLETGLLMLLALLPFVGFTPITPITGLNTTNILVLGAFSLSLLRYIGRPRPAAPLIAMPLLLFFLIALIGWVVGIINFHSLGLDPVDKLKLVYRWASFVLLYFTYFFGWSERIPVKRAFHWMFASIVVVSAHNVMDVVSPSYYYAATGRAGGVFGNANANGMFLAAYGFLAIVLMEASRSAMRRALYLAAFGLIVFGIGLSLSRAAFLMLLGNGLIYSFFRSRQVFAVALLVICLLIPVYSFILPEKVVDRINVTFEGSEYEGIYGKLEGSAANRVMQYIAAWHLFLDSPILGHGLGGYQYLARKYFPAGEEIGARSAHSTYVGVLVNLGVVGLGCIVWLLASLGLSGKRLYDSHAEKSIRLLGLFMITVAVGKAVGNLFATDLLTGDTSSFVWVSGGLVMWLNQQARSAGFGKESMGAKSGWRARGNRAMEAPVGHG